VDGSAGCSALLAAACVLPMNDKRHGKIEDLAQIFMRGF